ncbi:MAG: DEAD/DEAH box helicase family protein [Rhodocyclaceae bacterium]|nr:DEAD/DEAH box helicase family protein [Rhodocyclaceae bacterium]MCA3082501.1 DEAD/DEAH box helicase family protein [Rhodocyclaceae bacterium]
MNEAASNRAATGIAESTLQALVGVFEQAAGIDSVWIYGSRARGNYRPQSDIDLTVDAPNMSARDFAALAYLVEALGLLYRVDISHWQRVDGDEFRQRLQRERKIFWAPFRGLVRAESSPVEIGALEMKDFQQAALKTLNEYVDELNRSKRSADKVAAMVAKEPDPNIPIPDFPAIAWQSLEKRGGLPMKEGRQPYSSRFDGAGRPIPNVCIKIPTGGGKTLIGAAAVSQLQSRYLRSHTGLVIWVVPNEAIYAQTKKALANRDHPYRQLLNVAGAGRVKILEKDSPLSRMDVDSNLCLMLLMLQSAARQSKETLRFFRDRGNVLGFFPREDDIDGHWATLQAIPNLDVYSSLGTSAESVVRNKGSIIKDSLGNVMRARRPIVVIDEGHHAYTENALKTIDGFNPSFVLELSATPRVAKKASEHGANVLVDVHGSDLERADMIKLPINVDVRPGQDWRSCLTASLNKLNELQTEAAALEGDTGRYIRPILLVQVERTGADQTESGLIHASDAEAHLLQLGLQRAEIAQKTSEKNDLSQPENIDLLSPSCRVRVIITKQALQEGWDCPFAYVLCALAAGRNQSAMTQLLGRILRQPHVAKTGRAKLDESYVFCHDAKTATVVESIKNSLEAEGMGDLTSSIRTSGGDTGDAAKVKRIQRRAGFAGVRIFLPRVTWHEGGQSRALSYESDILGKLDWSAIKATSLAADWLPQSKPSREQQFSVGLEVLASEAVKERAVEGAMAPTLDRVFIGRAIGDLVPNTWTAYSLVNEVIAKMLSRTLTEEDIASSATLLIEQLRQDLTLQRDKLAEQTFQSLVASGNIKFGLRADNTAYELPHELEIELPSKPRPLIRENDAKPVDKSLFEPFYETMAGNEFEAKFACYLDSAEAVTWWHRNVARAHYGLQGWKRNKVYPDFVFLKNKSGKPVMVVMETKGAHLKNEDTGYKQSLFARLTAMHELGNVGTVGELQLSDQSGSELVCDLVFDENWQNQMAAKL